MSVQLQITFRGEEHGLQEGHLSLDAFGSALPKLLKAYRGTASAMLAKAHGDRLQSRSYNLDLLLVTQKQACLQMVYDAKELVAAGGNELLFEDLTARAAEQLVRDIAAEARGQATSRFARDLLTVLPDTVLSQTYIATQDGVELARADVGEFELAELPRELPVLERAVGTVVAARFDVGREQVTLRDLDAARTHRFEVTREQLDAVIEHREGVMSVMALRSMDGLRAVWIRPGDDVFEVSASDRTSAILTKWSGVLEGLA